MERGKSVALLPMGVLANTNKQKYYNGKICHAQSKTILENKP